MSEKMTYTIGEFTQQSGTSIRTLRYYDSIGLLKPSDYTEGGHRLYSEDDLHQLHAINALKFLGFPLKDIKEMLQLHIVDGTRMTQSLQYQKQLLTAKQQQLQETIDDLSHLIAIFEGKDTVNIYSFCAMLHMQMFEEDTQAWHDKYLLPAVGDILNRDKEEELLLEKEWADLITDMKWLANNGVPSQSEVAQNVVKQLFDLTNRTMKGRQEEVFAAIPEADPLHVPNPFTQREQQFLHEAIRIYNNHE